MQYSPKLKKAMEEIKAVIKKHDIAGMVVLHTPGHSEYFIALSPSYSCAKVEHGQVRVKAKLTDFGGDKKEWTLKVTDTSNMLNLIGEVAGRTALTIMELSKQVDKAVNAEHTGGGHSSHTEQNN